MVEWNRLEGNDKQICNEEVNMQRLGMFINQRNRQTGGMTVFTAVLVLIVLTLMIFYAARVGRMEQNISSNDVRQKLAFHAAEEALEQGVEYFKANQQLLLSDEVGEFPAAAGGLRDGWAVAKWKPCTTDNIADLTHPCGGQVPMRPGSYYYDDGGYAITGIISESDNVGVTARLTANMCQIDLDFPETCLPLGTATDGGTFMIATLMGYGYSDCTNTANTATCQGAATVSKPIGNWKALAGAPTVPLVTRSVFPPNGTAIVVPNPNGGGVGVPISAWVNDNATDFTDDFGESCPQNADAVLSSGTWNTCEMQEWYEREAVPALVACDQPTCSCTADESISYKVNGQTTVLGIDIVKDNQFPCDLFKLFFGTFDDDYANFKPTATILPDCSSLNPNSSGFYWISGPTCRLNGPTYGSPDSPLVIISAAENTSIAGSFELFGVLYVFDQELIDDGGMAEFTGAGTASIYGALIIDADMEKFTGTINVVYSDGVLRKASDLGGFGSINGGWRDFGLPDLPDAAW
ncbi:hypothetical protein ACFL1J_04260 [Pseudomonadota bacterium]